MTTPIFLAHEIGSLAKPSWRVKAFSGASLTDKDILEADTWGKKLDIAERESLLRILAKKKDFDENEKREIMRMSSVYATKLLEKAGLDLVWDGEQHRVEMYEYAVRRIPGFVFHGTVRSFDNKYYSKASCTEAPRLDKPFHIEEYKQIAKAATKQIKIPLTGAYTIVDWSFDEHYIHSVIPGKDGVKEHRHQARKEFIKDIAQNVIYPNIKALYDQGARFIQIDEPAATTKRDEIPEFIASVKHSIGNLAGKAFFTIHICFSEYSLLFPAIKALEGILDEIHFEYANRDSRELGVDDDKRLGYSILEKFRDTSFKVGLGVLDVHTDFVESPELIRDRILYANKIIGDPSRIYIAPDCGLRTRTWEVAFDKLRNMVEGRELAKKSLGM